MCDSSIQPQAQSCPSPLQMRPSCPSPSMGTRLYVYNNHMHVMLLISFQAIFHPDTNERIFMPFRMSGRHSKSRSELGARQSRSQQSSHSVAARRGRLQGNRIFRSDFGYPVGFGMLLLYSAAQRRWGVGGGERQQSLIIVIFRVQRSPANACNPLAKYLSIKEILVTKIQDG